MAEKIQFLRRWMPVTSTDRNVQEVGLCGWVHRSMGDPQIWGALMSLFGAQLCVCLWRLKSIRNLLGVRAPLRLQWLVPWRGLSGPPQPHFLHRAGAVRQSGSTGQMPGQPWSIKTCRPTVPWESNREEPAWKRSLSEGWLCSGGSMWYINGFVFVFFWFLFFGWFFFVCFQLIFCFKGFLFHVVFLSWWQSSRRLGFWPYWKDWKEYCAWLRLWYSLFLSQAIFYLLF